MKDRKCQSHNVDLPYDIDRREHCVRYTSKDGKDILLYGELHAPAAAGRYPAVIMSHGFNGHYSDFPEECRRFAGRGYVCYAYDFCGAQLGGKSTGRTASEYSADTMIEDLKAVIADIRTLENVDAGQIFLFGGSQGGFVTGLTAADEEVKDQITAIAMYFPAFNIPEDWRGVPARNTPLMGYSIGGAYIRSMQGLDPYGIIGGFAGDVCIVWGAQDGLVTKPYIDRSVQAYGGDRVQLTVLPDAGHGFTGEAVTAATETVLAFLEAHTVRD